MSKRGGVLLIAFTCITFTLINGLSPAAQAAQKHALLIGISDYGHFHADTPEAQRAFHNLDCAQDVTEIETALVHTFGFADPAKQPEAGEIVTLTTPEQTTKNAILAALQHLVELTQPGDIVYIHYSGHGDLVTYPSEPTGFDSAIVPADYQTPPPNNKTETTSNEIVGRTILGFIRRLQAKRPAQIALSFDSCHSASAARGATPTAKCRGITSDEYAAWYADVHPNYHGGSVKARSAQPAEGQDDLTGAGYVVISACRNTDKAYETNGTPAMGRLSDCLAHALMAATPQTTYRQIYDEVYATFHERYPDQHPQLDGSDPDAPLLGGKAIVPPPSYLVLVDAPGHYRLDVGSLFDMTVGSSFAIYRKNDMALKPGTEIATAQIITPIGDTTSTLQVTLKNEALTPDDLSSAHAVETSHFYDTPPLALDADSLRRVLPGQADAILARLQELKMVSVAPPAPGRDYDVAAAPVSRGAGAPALVRVSSGAVIATLEPTAADLPEKTFEALEKEARYRYACGLGEEQAALNHMYHVKLRLLPSDPNGTPLPQTPTPTADQRPILSLNANFIVQVQNTSGRPLHLAVLDLGNDESIAQIWPAPGSAAQDNIILPTQGDNWTTLWDDGGDTTQKAIFKATSADPDEMYKAIATRAADREGGEDEYVDFNPLAQRGASRGPDNPFSDLFGPAVDAGVRGTARVPISVGAWTVSDYAFQIK